MIPHSYLRAVALLAAAPILLTGQNFDQYQIERLAAGFRYTNGPVWARDGHMLFTDTPSSRVLKWVPGGRPETLLESMEGAAGLALDPQGRLYICESRGRRVVRIEKGKAIPIAESFQGKRFNAPNDIVVRRDGQVYFTDPAFGYQQDSRELDFYGIFRVTPRGEISAVAKWSTRPNGITMNFAGRQLYVVDSDRRAIRSFELDKAGAATNERALISGIEGVPRGIAVDEKGNLYVAAKHVDVYSPEGRRIWRFNLPSPPSSCNFGDPDLQGLYVTAGDSLFRIRLNVKGAVQQ
jgi:gluconolactonase